jgi:molybdate transport system substrate-binding protein
MSSPAAPLRAISSMATRQLLADLVVAHQRQTGAAWQVESVGGVDAAKRVAAGEAFDLVLLASDAIDELTRQGHLIQGSRVDWVLSSVVVAVPEGVTAPDISSEALLQQAVMQAPSLGISTGPSGNYVEKLIRGWGLAELLEQRRIVPPPGTPVGQLIAQGKVALGFQQRSEMVGLQGVQVLGPLPDPVAYTTIFSAGVPKALHDQHPNRAEVNQFLAFLASSDATPFKHQHGMSELS